VEETGDHHRQDADIDVSAQHSADVTDGYVNIWQTATGVSFSHDKNGPLWWMKNPTNLSLYLSDAASIREDHLAIRKATHDSHSVICSHDFQLHQQYAGKTASVCWPSAYDYFQLSLPCE
jgi:hypothetical protein